jgi:hypothetical protein
MLADSRFIRELQLASNLANVDIQLDVIVDKIYNILTRGIVSLRKDPTNNNEREEDRAGSKFRIPVEWNFGKINLHFPFVNIYFRLKINEREFGTYINVAALLTNIHTCLYGSQCANYFSQVENIIKAPTLEDYMQV